MKNLITLSLLITLTAGILRAESVPVEERKSLSQYGITWEFDHPVKSGQFITGDWWIIGPVTITKITPEPGPLTENATVDIKKDQFGDSSLRNDIRMRNGSSVAFKCSYQQGYDSRSETYDPALSVRLPLKLEANRSLISTISNTKFPVDNLCKDIMWTKEKVCQQALRAAAVLTCLASVPPKDAFRPAYVGTEKVIYQEKDLKWDLLLKLKPAGPVPSWTAFERYFQRPWIEQLVGWGQQELNPNENQTGYGRENARLISMASLMLHLDVPKEQKRKLLIGLVQYGLDISGCAKNGGDWNWGGGHPFGRKWPVLFAGLMLGDPKIYQLPETAIFGEDSQSYNGKGWFGQTALWQMVRHHGKLASYEEKPPEKWEKWDTISEDYRVSCTSAAWVGTALAARMMKAIKAWDHDAFFDYVDRWMRTDDPYAAARGTHPRPEQETTTFDPFVTEMWKAYRATAPEQARSGKNLKFVWDNGKPAWVDNSK